jgi:hypothetical protein
MSVNSGIVTMGNGAYCKITGIGNIRIKMFNGVVRMLCDVRHVPKVEKNLISLGTLLYKLNVLTSARVVCNMVVCKCEVESTGSCIIESKFKPKIILF